MSTHAPSRLSRRQLLRFVAVLGSAMAATPLMQACQSAAPAAKPAADQKPAEQKPAAAAAPAQAPAQTGAPAKPAGARPDWAAAAEPYKGKKVTILMSAGPWGKSHETMLPEFNQLTGINIVYDLLPEEQIPVKLQTSVLSRSGEYDAVVMIWDWMAQYNKAGLIADLMPYYTSPGFPAWDIEEYPARLVEFLRPEGRMIGIPVGAPAQIMMYRKDLFAEAGLSTPDGKNTSWQQIYEWAKRLNKPGVAGAVFGWKAGGIYAETMNIIPADKPLLDQDKRLSVYREPRVLEVYEIWARMYAEGLISKDVLALNIVEAWAKFQSGQAAMQPLSWPIAIATMEDPEKSTAAGKIGYTETPGGTPRIGGWGGLVLADSKNKEAAYLHLAWIASIDTTVKEVLRNGNYNASTTKHFRANVEKYKPEILKRKNGAAEFEGMVASWAGIDKGRLVHPGIPQFATIGDAMYPSLAKVISGELPARDGLNQAADAGEKVLAEAGYYKQ